MVRLNRWWYALVALVIVGALFVDGYSYIYRLTTHQPLTGKLTQAPPRLGGKDLYLHKGLDLQGGTELTIAICKGFNNPEGTTCRNGVPGGDRNLAKAQEDTITVLNQRVNGLGVSEAVVQAQGSDQVLVQLPGVSLQQAESVVGTTAKLHFAVPVQGAPGPVTRKNVCPDNIRGDQQNLCNTDQIQSGQDYPQGYHWKIDPIIDASDVSTAAANFTQDGQWAVDIQFDSKGADEWSKVTQAAYAQPQGSPGNRVAIFLDNTIITAPGVVGPSSDKTQITGGFTQDTANRLASQITAGALPAEIATVQGSEVSATLGQDTVRKSIIAGVVGLIVIVLFMVGYYRFPGLLASLALLIYAAIVLAFYKLIPVTVTLAGLAGFVLSIGMAVDANVLIFERTRDELRHGRGIAVAVETGFRRAFPAIRDSNASTIIACAILYLGGSNVVKGFALTLGLGVLISFFSAVLITQSLLTLVLNRRLGRNPRLYTEIHEEYASAPPRGRFDIVGSRNLYFFASLVIIIPGILAILFWGFRLGLDFSGGNRIDATLQRAASITQVQRTADNAVGGLQPIVQAENRNQYAIRTLPSSSVQVQKLTTALEKEYGIARDATGREQIQFQFVGPTIARQLVRDAVLLVILSSAFIAIYLFFAFRRQRVISAWRFSVVTFFKLLHDVFVLAGLWAILGHFSTLGEVDSLFITAILTSVSFSIHDTIVVFDRVRENLRVGPRLTFDQIINLSTVQTMTRSLNTALTVVFVLLALFLFGGASIKGFVLALLIGIVAGTYSSIFNASTLLVAWQKSDRADSAPPPSRGVQRRVAARAA
ncbi:MAG: protein translocase subunit SecDF [Candidatus Dormibacteria bacterium]